MSSDLSSWIPTATAFLCGGIVGLERQIRGKPSASLSEAPSAWEGTLKRSWWVFTVALLIGVRGLELGFKRLRRGSDEADSSSDEASA